MQFSWLAHRNDRLRQRLVWAGRKPTVNPKLATSFRRSRHPVGGGLHGGAAIGFGERLIEVRARAKRVLDRGKLAAVCGKKLDEAVVATLLKSENRQPTFNQSLVGPGAWYFANSRQ